MLIDVSEAETTALKSDAIIAFNLACAYYDGNGVERDFRQAHRMWRWILQRPDLIDVNIIAECQFRIAWLYHSGVDFPVDHQRALFWFRKAAKNNSSAANYYCGWMYVNGFGVRENMKTSVIYFRRAAELGYEGNLIGEATIERSIDGDAHCEEPEGTADVLNVTMQAADMGNTEAQYSLGHFYATGEGVNQNTLAALYWWRKAAEQGHAPAQYRLSEAYRLGIGVEPDADQSQFWRLNAATNGYCESA